VDRAGHSGEDFDIFCSRQLLLSCTTVLNLPVSCGLRLTPDGSIWPVKVHCEGAHRKVEGGDGNEGDCAVDHL